MDRQYPLLQKKLEEIESMMLQSETMEMADASDRSEVEWKIGFLSNLLERERSSNPGRTPDHLSHIADRLSEIERSFKKPINEEIRLTEIQKSFRKSINKEIACHEEIVSMEDDLDDAASSCSCTHSCLNETDETQDEEKESDCVSEANCVSPSESKSMEAVQFFSNDHGEERAQELRSVSGRRCRTMVTLMVVVAAMIMAVTNFCTEEEHVFLVPT